MTPPATRKAPRLSERIGGHDNNFNLIRVTAALLVLLSHSFVVVTGSPDAEPLRKTLGLTFGSSAVDVFFIVSGLLVTRSIVKRDGAFAFVSARLLRVWPGLAISLLLTAYLLGPVVTSLPPASYLGSTETLGYVARGLVFSLAEPLSRLPGVFHGNPHSDTVNVSLWTLPIEVRMYTYLLALWLATRLAGRRKGPAFGVAVVLAFAYYLVRHFMAFHGAIEWSPYRLPFMFFTGAMASVFAPRIVLSRIAAAVAVLALLCAAALAGPSFFIVYSVTLAYLVLCVAYLPGGPALRYNALGDYSYGLYIYAWPVQQALIFALPGLSVPWHIALSIAATLPLAIASWHAVEKPAMAARHANWRLIAQPRG